MNQARQRDILFLAFVGAEACWIYTALLLIDVKAAGGDLPLLGLLSFYPLAFVAGKATRRLSWGNIRLFLLHWILWFVWFLALAKHYAAPFGNPLEPAWLRSFGAGLLQVSSVSSPQLLFMGSLLLWWLGGRLLRLRLDFSTSLTEFQFGVAVLLILFFFEAMWDLDLPGLVPTTMAFFVFSIAGTAVTHARESGGWLSGPFRSRWMGLLLFTMATVLIGSMLLVALVKPDILKLILSLLTMAWNFFWDLVFRIVSFLAGLFPNPEPAAKPALPSMPQIPSEPPSWVSFLKMPEWVRKVGSFLMVMIWMILILGAIWSVSSQIIHWLRQRLENLNEVEVEPLSGAFLNDLLYLLKAMLLWVSRFFRFLFRPFRPRKSRRTPSPEVSSIRAIYRRMLDWAASAGCPRKPDQTPYEYLGILVQWFPEGGQDFTLMTDHYVLVRYGDFMPNHDTLQQVRAAWENLRRFKPEGLVNAHDTLILSPPRMKA